MTRSGLNPALSADEIAAVMAATRQPTSELSSPDNGGIEIDAVLAPVSESVEHLRLHPIHRQKNRST